MSKENNVIPVWYANIEQEYINLMHQKELLEKNIKSLRTKILRNMNHDKIRKINSKDTEVTVINECDYRKILTEKLKIEHPDIYTQFSKACTISEHLQIRIKNKQEVL